MLSRRSAASFAALTCVLGCVVVAAAAHGTSLLVDESRHHAAHAHSQLQPQPQPQPQPQTEFPSRSPSESTRTSGFDVAAAAHVGTSEPGAVAAMTKCPVCGMMTVASVTPFVWVGNQFTHFCSENHSAQFRADPSKYLASPPTSSGVRTAAEAHFPSSMFRPASGASGSEDAAEACPVCGMAVPVDGDPHVALQHGQEVHACSAAHATEVADAPADYQAHSKVENFCVGGSVMWQGLHFAQRTCSTVLFQEWRLTTKGKTAIAVVGVILAAIFTEYLTALRVYSVGALTSGAPLKTSGSARPSDVVAVGDAGACTGSSSLGSASPDAPLLDAAGSHDMSSSCHGTPKIRGASAPRPPFLGNFLLHTASRWPSPLVKLVDSSLYGITMFFSYLVMLISMTFNLWLIFALVLGFAIGHALFPKSAGTLHCCNHS